MGMSGRLRGVEDGKKLEMRISKGYGVYGERDWEELEMGRWRRGWVEEREGVEDEKELEMGIILGCKGDEYLDEEGG
jgi:hypothetical protein